MELLTSFRESWKNSKSPTIHSVGITKKNTKGHMITFDDRRKTQNNKQKDTLAKDLKQSALTQRVGKNKNQFIKVLNNTVQIKDEGMNNEKSQSTGAAVISLNLRSPRPSVNEGKSMMRLANQQNVNQRQNKSRDAAYFRCLPDSTRQYLSSYNVQKSHQKGRNNN